MRAGGGGDRRARLTVATLNLYHFADPGVGWIAEGRAHDAASLDAKEAWLAALLAEIDADIVGFQEVVAVERLRRLVARAGYPSFATVAEPILDAGPPPVYRRAVQAIAARGPLAARPIAMAPAFAKCLGLRPHWDIRRPILRAEVETAAFGPAVVFVAHLKSPGAAPSDAPIHEPPADAALDAIQALSRAHAKAAIQRVAEASALFSEAAAAVADAPARPVLVLGDMNDVAGSATLAALSPWRVDLGDDRYRFLDAAALTPPPHAPAAPTHRSGAEGVVLDYILVSSALFPWRADAVGRIVARRVHDAHFQFGDPAESSDHAALSVTLEAISNHGAIDA